MWRFRALPAHLRSGVGSASAAVRERRREQSREIIGRLAQIFPLCFSMDNPQPLRVGLGKEIRRAGLGIPCLALRRALHRYTKGTVYLLQVIEGADRVDLGGRSAGVVSGSEAEFARQLLEQRQPPKARKPVTTVKVEVQSVEVPRRLGLQDLKKAALMRKAAAA
jgi:sRNA-binding protein